MPEAGDMIEVIVDLPFAGVAGKALKAQGIEPNRRGQHGRIQEQTPDGRYKVDFIEMQHPTEGWTMPKTVKRKPILEAHQFKVITGDSQDDAAPAAPPASGGGGANPFAKKGKGINTDAPAAPPSAPPAAPEATGGAANPFAKKGKGINSGPTDAPAATPAPTPIGSGGTNPFAKKGKGINTGDVSATPATPATPTPATPIDTSQFTSGAIPRYEETRGFNMNKIGDERMVKVTKEHRGFGVQILMSPKFSKKVSYTNFTTEADGNAYMTNKGEMLFRQYVIGQPSKEVLGESGSLTNSEILVGDTKVGTTTEVSSIDMFLTAKGAIKRLRITFSDNSVITHEVSKFKVIQNSRGLPPFTLEFSKDKAVDFLPAGASAAAVERGSHREYRFVTEMLYDEEHPALKDYLNDVQLDWDSAQEVTVAGDDFVILSLTSEKGDTTEAIPGRSVDDNAEWSEWPRRVNLFFPRCDDTIMTLNDDSSGKPFASKDVKRVRIAEYRGKTYAIRIEAETSTMDENFNEVKSSASMTIKAGDTVEVDVQHPFHSGTETLRGVWQSVRYDDGTSSTAKGVTRTREAAYAAEVRERFEQRRSDPYTAAFISRKNSVTNEAEFIIMVGNTDGEYTGQVITIDLSKSKKLNKAGDSE